VVFLSNIRLKIGAFLLKRKAKKVRRSRSFTEFGKVKNFLLLFESNEQNIPAGIQQLTNQLIDEGKVVRYIIYYSGNSKSPQIKNNNTGLVFTKSDCTFFYTPKKAIIRQFNNFEADYLIDLSINERFPLIYLAGISTTSLRAGRESALRIPHFDLMIKESEEKTMDLIKDIFYYLRQVPNICYFI
jgi:hypothetical protein